MLTVAVALVLSAAPAVRGVSIGDLATTRYENPFDGVFEHRWQHQEALEEARALLDHLAQVGPAALGMAPPDHPVPGLPPGPAPHPARGGRPPGPGRHPARRAWPAWDPRPAGVPPDAPRLTSVRALDLSPGRVEFLAVGTGPRGATFVSGTFHSSSGRLTDVTPREARGLSLVVSLKDLTLHLRDRSGQVHLVDPVGAGGYADDSSGVLMTPVLSGAVVRTPARAAMDPRRYRGRPDGSGYMIASRTHPEYYEGLPFIRLRRFDAQEDRYGIHGPISTGGTFPIDPSGGALAASLFARHGRDGAALHDALLEAGLVTHGNRLVRGRITNGCLRLRAHDLVELFAVLDGVPEGVPIEVTYGPDPEGMAHPFPYETRRFAISTRELDEDGLTVMYTAMARTGLSADLSVLPWPDPDTIDRLEAEARDRGRALAAGVAWPDDLRRLVAIDPDARRAIEHLSRRR